METSTTLRRELAELDAALRTGTLTPAQRLRVTSAMDTLRWALSERAILKPSKLALMK